jgi:hypothetical protein
MGKDGNIIHGDIVHHKRKHRKVGNQTVFGNYITRSFTVFGYYTLRPCESVTVSESRVFSGKCTGKTDNRNTNSSVHFRYRYQFRQGFPFENTKMSFSSPLLCIIYDVTVHDVPVYDVKPFSPKIPNYSLL